MIQRTWWPRLNPNAQLAKGLVFAGLGGGASTLQYADASGYGNHGTLTNMDPATDYVFVPSLGRWACDFDGVDEYVILSRNPPTTLSHISISAWVKVRQTGGDANGRFVDWYPAPCLYRHSVSGALGWYGNIGGSTRDDRISTLMVFDDTLKHISVTFDGANLCTYINGALNMTRTDWTGALSAPTNTFCIAGRSTSTDRCLIGKIGDVLVHHRALSPAEISQLADPSNTLLSGLILPPRRMVFPAASAGGAYSLDCDSIAFTLSSMAPDLLVGHVLDAAADEFTLAGQDAGLEQGYALSCDAGSFALTSQDATLTATRTLSCDSGEFVLTGQDASLESGATLSAESGSLTLTGQDASLLVGHILDAGSGEFTLTGQDVTLTYTPAGAYTITADAGSFSLTGQDATLTATRTLSCDSGTFTLTGQDATFQRGYTFACDAGPFTLSGQASTFDRTFALACNAGAFTLAGQAVTLTYSAALGSIYGTWTPPARSRTWTPAARSRTWTPQSRGN